MNTARGCLAPVVCFVVLLLSVWGLMLIAKSVQDDAEACERAGGVIVQMNKCVQRVELQY